MGRKCAVKDCLSESSRAEDQGVTFHKIPWQPDIRSKWFSLCKIPDEKQNVKLVFICSRHFLRKDFSNFKGKKYMLKQGVLPSVFPWDKSKLEEIKTNKETNKQVPATIEEPQKQEKKEVKVENDEEKMDIEPPKLESIEPIIKDEEIKEEKPMPIIDNNKPLVGEVAIKEERLNKVEIPFTTREKISYSINQRIEALDFNNVWYTARIIEEDYEENEVLVHFEKFSSKYDEWISMDSPRLRPLTSEKNRGKKYGRYVVGERCLASWSDARKFPATVTKVLGNDMYEVIFDDGLTKTVKAQKMNKSKPHHASPLFDPIQTTKEERRERKRKFSSGFAQLFKRGRYENDASTKSSSQTPSTTAAPPPATTSLETKFVPEESQESIDSWVPQWENGYPVGKESFIECGEIKRKSYIVPDPRLPPGWTKHISQRINGTSVGKWDTFIISPDNRRFRSKNEIKHYLDESKLFKYNESQFDFSLHRVKPGRKPLGEKKNSPQSPVPPPLTSPATPAPTAEAMEDTTPPDKEENSNHLKIPVIDNVYKCPIEGCNKQFRKENLAQMHVKHYHSEYTKFLDSTPNVADLAYARTVAESLEKSGVKVKKPQTLSHQQQPIKQQPQATKPVEEPSTTPSHRGESEIAKLLKNKEPSKEPEATTSTTTTTTTKSASPNSFADIKLKDLLSKSEGIPKSDEGKMNILSGARPSAGGIKTLLPVVRTGDNRRKRVQETVKGIPIDTPTQQQILSLPTVQPSQQPPSPSPPSPIPPSQQQQQQQQQLPHNNVIIEGGQVIKIVRMKQEEIINCTCGFTEEDGLMIQCDLCLCWQHAFCNNIERESQVPEKYICYICQNPYRQRATMKHLHDQDWLKNGTLPTGSYHSKDETSLNRRFEKLKKAHDISGGLLELKDYVNTLNIKLKIAEEKNHPKLYLWSKPWHKADEKKEKTEETGSESMLMMYLKGSPKEELSQMTTQIGPKVPQPEAAIDSEECRLNLLEHISNAQDLVDNRLDEFEKRLDDLDQDGDNYEDDEQHTRTRQTLKMLLRDLETVQYLANSTTL